GADGELLGFAKVTRDLTRRRAHDEELRRSEERFRLLVDGVSEYAIFMLDPNGRVATWNSGAERIKGYKASEIIGQHFSIFYPPDAKESGWPEHELRVAAEEGRFVDTGWRVRKDGTTFWANVTISALRDDSGQLLGYAKLTRDLTEIKRAEAMELANQQREEMLDAERNARMAAQRTTRLKDEFLATLSHELRTPLSAILGWTQVLLKDAPSRSADAQRRAVEVIDRNARAQVKLIDDLLDLSRITTGKLRLDLHQVSFASIVEAALDTAMPAATTKGIRLKVILGATQDVVSADSARLQQVVWNLLTNAIKFTPKGGQIQVLLQRVNSHLELSVSDTGIGIAEIICRTCSSDSRNGTARQRGPSAASAWAWRSPSSWSNCTAASSRRQVRVKAWAPHFPSSCRCRLFSCKRRVLRASIRRRRRNPPSCSRSRGSKACTSSSWTMNPMRASCCERCCKTRG